MSEFPAYTLAGPCPHGDARIHAAAGITQIAPLVLVDLESFGRYLVH